MSDVYLSYYITMFILYKFYGGKNKNPKAARVYSHHVARLMRLISDSKTILKSSQESMMAEEEELSINLISIAEVWNQKIAHETAAERRNTEPC